MGVAAAEGEQPNRVGTVDGAGPFQAPGDEHGPAEGRGGEESVAGSDSSSGASDGVPRPPEPSPTFPRSEPAVGSGRSDPPWSGAGLQPDRAAIPATGAGEPAGAGESGSASDASDAAPTDAETSDTAPTDADPPEPADSSLEPFILVDLLLLEPDDSETVGIDVVTFSDAGIGVIRSRGERPRVLPWSSVITHVVEPWSGGVIPEWWVDPELNRRRPDAGPVAAVTDPRATSRARPGREPGALIGIKTPSQTYRFLLPGGDARDIARKVAAFTVRFQGPTGASSVTRVVRWGQDAERRRVPRTPKKEMSWAKVQPFLVVALIVFLAASVTVILLQSAGAIHLPFLGGVGSGSMGPLRIR